MDNGPVAKKLWLHIGSEKTGTKTIQATCRLNREQLLQDGILYPQTPGTPSHTKLTLYSSDRADTLDLRRRSNLLLAEKYQQFRSSFVDELRAEVSASRCDTVCLSNEHLWSRIRWPKEIGRLANALRSLAETLTIIVYLRPQHELFVSRYSTWVKGGRTEPMTPPTRETDRRYNYEARLSRWANTFGSENIRVRIFDRKQFVDGDLIRDFFSVLGYVPSHELDVPRELNRTLDADALEFLRIFNRHVPEFGEETLNPERGAVSRALEAISKGHKVHVPEATLRNIAAIFEASNAKVAARFLKRTDGKLFDDLRFDSAPESKPLTVERAIEIAAHLWRWKQQRILKAKDKRILKTKDKRILKAKDR